LSEIEEILEQEAKQEEPENEGPNASQEIRKRFRELLKQGIDISQKDIYTKYCKQWSQELGVSYSVAKQARDHVAREGIPQPPKAPVVSQQVNGATITVSPKPKTVQAPLRAEVQAQQPDQIQQQQGQAQLQAPNISEEMLVSMFATMHETIAMPVFMIGEYFVEGFQKPSEVELKKKYEAAGKVWAEVCKAYGISIPKVMLLFGAIGYSASIIVTPVLGPAAKNKMEQVKKRQEERKRNAEAKLQEQRT
jgi:hypothetical protein